MTTSDTRELHGQVSPGFEGVRGAFVENFARRRELGGACCAFYRGNKVVDLWGGIRNEQTAEPWEQDTMVVVHSATKSLAAMTLAIAHSRRWLNYEERVCTYWPEFDCRLPGASRTPSTSSARITDRLIDILQYSSHLFGSAPNLDPMLLET